MGVFFGHLAYMAVIDPGVRSVDDPRLYLMLVAAGLGVALLARSATERPGPAIGVCELARPPEHPPIGLIRSHARPLPPAARAFWDHLAATAEGAGGGPRAAPGG